ncbi:MAG: DUF3459 domain-containing protein [Clostridia bacterium]|nr:DUF3459 domain-containing protein [Clostridia bacterium]
MAYAIDDQNKVRVQFTATRTPHAELFTAFEYGEELHVLLTLREEYAADSAEIRLFCDDTGRTVSIKGEKQKDESFLFTIRTDSICPEGQLFGLFYYAFYTPKFIVAQNEFGEGYMIAVSGEQISRFQLSVYRPGTNAPSVHAGGIIYQIFPDRFAKGKGAPVKEGAVLEEDWYAPISEYQAGPGLPVKNNHFFGGTLWGVIEKLDYLKTLGVSVIYLNPIFEAASNHKYDTADYSTVDRMFGGEEALRELITEAKKRDIGIVLDGVFNHTGDDSLYFNKYGNYPGVGAYQSKDSAFYPWFLFTSFPEKYESWWGISILPKVNGSNPEFIDFIAGKGGIIEKYTRMGLLGWRLDVADELSDKMLDAIRARVSTERPDGLIYGEVWEDASNKIAYSHRRHYFNGGQLNAVMNYPLKNAIISYLQNGDAESIYYAMRILYSHYPKAVSDLQMNILSTHDTERILTVLAGSPEGYKPNSELAEASLTKEERAQAVKLLKLAVILQVTLPGMPCIYYGDEIGMEGYHDPFNRRPYPWGKEDQDVLAFYRTAMALRTQYPLLKDAYYRGVLHQDGVFVFDRFTDEERIRVIVNCGEQDFEYEVEEGGVSIPDMQSVKETLCVKSGAYALLYFKEENT